MGSPKEAARLTVSQQNAHAQPGPPGVAQTHKPAPKIARGIDQPPKFAHGIYDVLPASETLFLLKNLPG